jgi:hypothetical protein
VARTSPRIAADVARQRILDAHRERREDGLEVRLVGVLQARSAARAGAEGAIFAYRAGLIDLASWATILADELPPPAR